MAKGSGTTRTTNSANAAASRTVNMAAVSTQSGGGANTAASVTQTAKYDADYISNKTKEIKGFKLPKANDFEYINIKGTTYRVRHEKTYDGRHIVDLIRTSDNYSMGRDVFTSGGSYGMATTRTRSQVVNSLRNELLNLLKHG